MPRCPSAVDHGHSLVLRPWAVNPGKSESERSGESSSPVDPIGHSWPFIPRADIYKLKFQFNIHEDLRPVRSVLRAAPHHHQLLSVE